MCILLDFYKLSGVLGFFPLSFSLADLHNLIFTYLIPFYGSTFFPIWLPIKFGGKQMVLHSINSDMVLQHRLFIYDFVTEIQDKYNKYTVSLVSILQ